MDQEMKDLKCGFCKRGKEVESDCGKLWHDELQKCTAHKKCMQYSALLIQYKMRRFGGFQVNRVIKEIQRGNRLKCTLCVKDRKPKKFTGGATVACALKKCKKTFHFYCAHKDKKAINKRIELKKSTGASVLYRIFCGDDHRIEFFKGLKCRWSAKGSDSEEENNESCSESEDDKSNEDESGESSDSESKSSSRRDNGDVSKKEDDDGQQQQQQAPSSGSKNGATIEKVGSESHGGSISPSDSTVLDIFGDRVSATERPADMSGCNLSEAAQSLAHAKDGSSDATQGFLQEGRYVHPGDVGRSNADDMEASAKKKLDGGGNGNKSFLGTDDTVFVVCFLEKHDLADAKTIAILQKLANKVFNIPPDAIFLWQCSGRPLSPGYVVYLLSEISKALWCRDEDELHRLMFDIQDKDISKFDSAVQHNDSLSNEKRDELYANIGRTILENFEKAEQSCGQCVGKLCLIKPLSTHVGFVLLCRNTDATGVARSQMRGEKPIYVWDRELVLAPYDRLEISNRGSMRQRECDRLQRYLKDVPVSRVHSWPKDVVLSLADEYSVTGRLHSRYSSNLTSAGAHLIFLGPVDRSIMHYGLYISKRIMIILDELLTAQHEVYCVLDVGPEVGLCSLMDIIPRLSPGIELEALIANDPKLMHASCAVLHFSLSV